jgi:hypothetical protein
MRESSNPNGRSCSTWLRAEVPRWALCCLDPKHGLGSRKDEFRSPTKPAEDMTHRGRSFAGFTHSTNSARRRPGSVPTVAAVSSTSPASFASFLKSSVFRVRFSYPMPKNLQPERASDPGEYSQNSECPVIQSVPATVSQLSEPGPQEPQVRVGWLAPADLAGRIRHNQ